MPIIIFLFASVVIITVLIRVYTLIKRVGISRLILAPSLEVENTELLNKLLKKRVAEDATLSDEDLALIEKLRKSQRVQE